jgi:hypothetical protein
MPLYDDPDAPLFFGEVIGSSNSYHLPTCHIIRQIKKRNYKRLRDWKEAVALQLSPCPLCRPYSPPTPADVPVQAGPEPEPEAHSHSQVAAFEMSASELADTRRELLRLLDLVDRGHHPPQKEGPAARIARLTNLQVIPRPIAACMKTVTEMRNASEYDAKQLSAAESAAVRAAWAAVKEWAANHGFMG